MQISSAPAKLTKAFAFAGNKNTVPVPSQITITPGAASFTDGFPPLTMTDPDTGGVPPAGLDFNGIFFQTTGPVAWANTGAGYLWDEAFSAAIGGYPRGAQVVKATGIGYWVSIVDDNVTDPDTGGAGWIPAGSNTVSAVYASTQQTMPVGSNKLVFDTVEFDSQSQWNAANRRFVAQYAGNYRLSGGVFMPSPPAQTIELDIWKNGSNTGAKRCYQFPQVSDADLFIPFSAITACAVGDYLEPYLTLGQASALVGAGSGSNEGNVYLQCEYLGT